MLAAWPEIVERLGFPVALVAVAIFFAWRIGRFLGPPLLRVFESTENLHQSLKASTATITAETQRHTQLLDSLHETADQHGNLLDRHGRLIGEIHEKIVLRQEQSCDPSPKSPLKSA